MGYRIRNSDSNSYLYVANFSNDEENRMTAPVFFDEDSRNVFGAGFNGNMNNVFEDNFDEDGDDVLAAGFNGNGNNVETIVYPTREVVNVNTNRRTIRRIFPTHIRNINRNITRIENYYPVTQSVENVNIVREYDCGRDINNPRCRPVNHCRKKCHKKC